MNKLWVRFSLAFAFVTIIGLTIVALVINSQVNEKFRRFMADDLIAQTPLVERLVDYYETEGSWQGVDRLLRHMPGFRPPQSGNNNNNNNNHNNRDDMFGIILANKNGEILYDNHSQQPTSLSYREREKALPLISRSKVIGYLVVNSPPSSELTGPARAFLSQIIFSLIQAGLIAGILGILLGVALARGMAAPLSKLVVAAGQISKGKLNQQVPVKGAQEIAELSTAFNEMATALEEGETLRRNMVADVAHELRTPLSVLQGNLRAILDEVYPLDKSEITRLYDQTRLLGRLVNDLHELAQAEAHQLPLNLHSTDLNQLVLATADKFDPIAEAEEITLTTEVAPQPVKIVADGARLAQVLHNLIANALRHTPAGGTITLQASQDNGHVCLSVADTGEGIPPEHLHRVFERFYRTDRARSRDKGGTGLGLAIARAIIEAHGGNIQAESSGTAGQGSTFTIQLPLSPPE